MDDWQDAALSTRHMHNRVGRNGARSGGGGKSHRGGSFDVRKSFGSYSCKCAAWKRARSDDVGTLSDKPVVLELFRLTTDGQGVVGELALPGVLRASVILAASRKSLGAIISRLDSKATEDGDDDDAEEGEEVEDEEQRTIASHDRHADGEHDDEGEGEKSTSCTDENTQDRFDIFEKNSFRCPKFWLQWSGVPTLAAPFNSRSESTGVETGLGYVVFAGNDCRKFSGTINCSVLGWKDVSISGHKIASRSESDIPVTWESNGSAL